MENVILRHVGVVTFWFGVGILIPTFFSRNESTLSNSITCAGFMIAGAILWSAGTILEKIVSN